MAITELDVLLRNCIHQRLHSELFHGLLTQYKNKSNFTSKEIVATFVRCSTNFCVEGDPLLVQYLQLLVRYEFFEISELLVALSVQWNSSRENPTHLANLVTVHSQLVTNLSILVAASRVMRDIERNILLCARWLEAQARLVQGGGRGNNGGHLAAAVTLLVTTLLNACAEADKSIHTAIQSAADQCVIVFPDISMQLMTKMSTMPKSSAFEVDGHTDASSQMVNMALFEFESNIHNPPIVATRSATTVHLNSLLRAGSTIDDSTLFSFLNARYQGACGLMFSDLIHAAIDAMLRTTDSPNEMYQAQCQTFMLSKLPSVLAFIVTSTSAFEGFSSETLLTDAWTYLRSLANTDQSSIGKRFLQISTLYHLISSEAVNDLIGDESLEPLKGLYVREDLVTSVTANHSRGPRLIDELLKNDGNTSILSLAIQDIMHNYCRTKETTHLKEMANAITRKPASINALSLFVKPAIFLGPFCNLLDDWKWDDIHGESQPVYDEFGSILLLIMAVKQRLRLQPSQLGVQQAQGFVTRYMSEGYREKALKQLPAATQSHLGDWIKSFYVDEGLSDDLTTKCSAQEFYLLIPTLLRQSMMAWSKGRLTTDVLKSGLEFLLDPFLLPSLLSVFGWIEQIVTKEAHAVRIVIETLVKASENSDARDIQRTILAMAADQFEMHGLAQIPEIEPLLASVPKNSTFGVDVNLRKDDFSAWQRADGGVDILFSQNTLGQVDAAAPAYDPRLLIGANEIHGPKKIMHLFVNLLIQYSESHSLHPLLDLIATMIVSNDISLRYALQVLHNNLAGHLQKGENVFVEATIHLQRRVELYMSALATRTIEADQNFIPMTGLNVANVDLDIGTAPTFEQNIQAQSEDIDQVLNDAAIGSLDQVDSSGLDDIYGFSGGDLNLGSLDDLDLEMF